MEEQRITQSYMDGDLEGALAGAQALLGQPAPRVARARRRRAHFLLGVGAACHRHAHFADAERFYRAALALESLTRGDALAAYVSLISAVSASDADEARALHERLAHVLPLHSAGVQQIIVPAVALQHARLRSS
jgi:hypothetical protein